MAEATTSKELQCVVVTPEKALLDTKADFVALPMYDGELGVLPGRAALVGRLGHGELRIRKDGEVQRFFVDEGFAQVRNNVVTVLTSRALPASQIDKSKAKAELDAAVKETTKNEEEIAERLKKQERARAQLHIAEKAQS